MYGTNPENDTIALLPLLTDYLFTCPSRRFLSLSNYSQSGRWLYLFNHTLSFNGWGPYAYCQDYVCHGAELPFVYVRIHSFVRSFGLLLRN
jgi:acetylcholinesterase/cholinesterase